MKKLTKAEQELVSHIPDLKDFSWISDYESEDKLLKYLIPHFLFENAKVDKPNHETILTYVYEERYSRYRGYKIDFHIRFKPEYKLTNRSNDYYTVLDVSLACVMEQIAFVYCIITDSNGETIFVD